MAAFAAAVKIDSFAYMPVQDFGNAFSTFVAQNFGAGKKDRIHRGTRVVLAYVLSAIPAVGVTGIWMSVPIGWILADATGILYMYKLEKNKR